MSDAVAIVITGMHRSGTSLVASLAQAAGVDIGRDLHRADGANRKGYFEDVEFLALERAAVAACCPTGEPGWADWGWTASERFDRAPLDAFRTDAAALVESRRERGVWGWKDPRTTLLLDFWESLLPEPRYVFVYRPPWEVADSLFRLRHPAFSAVLDFPFRVWCFYNRELLSFCRRYRDRSLLLRLDRVLAAPVEAAGRIVRHAGLAAGAPGKVEGITEHALAGAAPLDGLFGRWCVRRFPEAQEALAALDREAARCE